jgi:hypothetical protein
MTKADSVHSTPRKTAPKIDPTRRQLLTIAAGDHRDGDRCLGREGGTVMSGEIVEFPKPESKDETKDVASLVKRIVAAGVAPWQAGLLAADDLAVDKRHADAFRDVEGPLLDCLSMAKIAFDLMANTTCDDRELAFAVAHTWEMLSKLSKDYYAAYERQP